MNDTLLFNSIMTKKDLQMIKVDEKIIKIYDKLKTRFKYDSEEEVVRTVYQMETYPKGACYSVANYLYFKLLSKGFRPKAYFMWMYQKNEMIEGEPTEGTGNTHAFIVLPDNMYIEISAFEHQGIFISSDMKNIFHKVYQFVKYYNEKRYGRGCSVFGGLVEYTPDDKPVKSATFERNRILKGKKIIFRPPLIQTHNNEIIKLV